MFNSRSLASIAVGLTIMFVLSSTGRKLIYPSEIVLNWATFLSLRKVSLTVTHGCYNERCLLNYPNYKII